jgi:flavin reductase (DIM6/NTAB) family NADH-FMN oxidoreductase RutF
MRQLAGGVAVITVGLTPYRSGYMGTAVFSLSVDPQRVVISVGRGSSSYPLIRQHGLFGLNVLAAGQQAVADRFAGRGGIKGEARYEGDRWNITPRGVSLLAGAIAAAECAVEEIIERHSHALIIGEPLSISASADSGALLYWRSSYRSLGDALRVAAE